jgi:hypothetical protein
MTHKWEILAVLAGLQAACLLGAQNEPVQTPSILEKVRRAAQEGKIAYKLTTPEELKELLGRPANEKKVQDGGMELLTLQYPNLMARFGRMRDFTAPFTLLALGSGGWLDLVLGPQKGGPIDIGQDRQVVLRSEADLAKFDPFRGLAGVSLARLDLREHRGTLERMPFDSRTVWPPPDRLPEDFDPARRLEEGKNPGLGVRRPHAEGIDGHGVGIAIIDQPLLQNHVEYAERLVRYEPIEVPPWMPPQMHGSPICSIAVGKNCGVAPRASLYYYAVPTWNWRDDKPWAELLEKIVEFNKGLTDQPKTRIVSISLGAFSERPGFDLWQAAVAKAARNGILVVTCDPTFLRYGTLKRDPLEDPNDPTHYRRARYSVPGAVLWVPVGNRTMASHQGPSVYTYDIEGGMSWGAPYLAGLAALAFQVDPEIRPAQIVELWTATATKTTAGPVVNPPKFIEAVQSRASTRSH